VVSEQVLEPATLPQTSTFYQETASWHLFEES